MIVGGAAAIAAGFAFVPLVFVADKFVPSDRRVDVAAAAPTESAPLEQLVLEPTVTTRGRSGSLAANEIRPKSKEVLLSLSVRAPSAGKYDVQIKSVDSGMIVFEERELRIRDTRFIDIHLAVPSLSPGSYIVETSRRTASGTEPADSYRFRLLPVP